MTQLSAFDVLFAEESEVHDAIIHIRTSSRSLSQAVEREVAKMTTRMAEKARMQVIAFRRVDPMLVELGPLEESGFTPL